MIHNLKVHPQFWEALISGKKAFDLRRNDRKFQICDTVLLKRYDPVGVGYTGEECEKQITYVLFPEDCPGLQPGYVILGFRGYQEGKPCGWMQYHPKHEPKGEYCSMSLTNAGKAAGWTQQQVYLKG